MTSQAERLKRLNQMLVERRDICCSEGSVDSFPVILQRNFQMDYLGVIVCEQGEFQFTLNQKLFVAKAGETIFLSEATTFCAGSCTADLRIDILFYRIDPIRELLGSSVVAMHLYATLTPQPCYVWSTGEEEDIARYISLISRYRYATNNSFDNHERKLLLLALTYRLCSIYSRQLMEENQVAGHKIDTFIQLIRLIERYYKQERGVAFYADKLCLSPKYLSALSKSVCGYTVQELVFRAIIRRSMLLLKNSNKTIQEISNEFHFPNASAFGTFFKKETGLSPLHYRCAEENSLSDM
ncbi:helix-turn-helix domain-containing protein [Phocaeicola plebeius]|uniref:helix-turn-helix domain-containing protein n=1 Tax=Phocaeicola plebeius TaxID=310297 RepID=UPI0026EB96D2|nr:helix-turn-helix domain-containing protein [Phocaeicola plebeius]MDD6913960.1 helix-turn-helix domain-containing protein [Phocaeicola plebeius]MDY5978167.1 helix-turn-helix domain-containing protein [Phocaeicola plebeius]